MTLFLRPELGINGEENQNVLIPFFTCSILADSILFCICSPDFDMTEAQQEHAEAVKEVASRLAAVHHELCPAIISFGRFWKIYFVLLHSRLSREDSELLSTPQVCTPQHQLPISRMFIIYYCNCFSHLIRFIHLNQHHCIKAEVQAIGGLFVSYHQGLDNLLLQLFLRLGNSLSILYSTV